MEYVGGEEKNPIQEEIVAWLDIDPIQRPAMVQQFVRTIRSQEEFSGIAEIHPAWLLEPLKNESPRVIGVILRHIPSKHVRYILEHLPRRTVEQLPKLVESFFVPKEILSLIRRRFERHFLPLPCSRTLRKFEFSHLYYLRNEELDLLFRALGMAELAYSFAATSKKIVQVILNRFSVTDARHLLEQIKKYRDADPGRISEARYTVLELGGEKLGSELFLKELGIASLARGFTAGDDFLYQALRQKLDPAQSYLLKRYIDVQVQRGDVAQARLRQKWILGEVAVLSHQGRIDPLWAQYLMAEAA